MPDWDGNTCDEWDEQNQKPPKSRETVIIEALAFKQALRNCHMIARRELNRPVGKERREQWAHVLRICEQAGIKGNILRFADKDI